MRYISYCFSTLLLLLLLSSCGSESTPVYNLTTTPTPNEAGSVSPSTGEYDEGEAVEITATPNDDWLFDGWEGDASGSDNPTSITMDGDKDIAATFVLRDYPLTVEIEGEGTVQENVVQEKTTDYPAGTTVKLTANAADGWIFIEWQGDLEGDENPQQITVDDDKSVTAVFERQYYDLTIEIQGEGNVEQEVVQTKTTEYEGGTQVKLTATSEDDWRFVGWKEEATGTESEITVTVDRDKTIIASFDNSDFEGGDGSEDYPYEVATVEQLQEIRNYTNKHFVQINDIDASVTSTWNLETGFQPIGDDLIPFEGSYNGNAFIISNLFIETNSKKYVGLFGYAYQATIKKVTLQQVDITLQGNDTGAITAGLVADIEEGLIYSSIVTGNVSGFSGVAGLVGINRSSSIRNSSTDVNITGTRVAGGLVAGNSGEIEQSNSNGTIEMNGDRQGGLVGSNSGTIIDSYSSVDVTSTGYSPHQGGLVGINNTDALIENSYSTGTVNSQNDYIGGLTGFNRGIIKSSFSSSNVTGNLYVGGLVGRNEKNIINSYSLGNINGQEQVGGLIGVNSTEGSISNTFATGRVSGNTDIGGLVGINGNLIESGYWDSESTEQGDGVGRGSSDEVIGLMTSEIQGTAAEENMPEFDWDEIWMTVSGDYPILRWQE